MTLENIRNADEKMLCDALRELIRDQDKLTLGELHATTRTIYDRALKIGASIDKLNAIARGER